MRGVEHIVYITANMGCQLVPNSFGLFLFHSLQSNRIGSEGASALADVLRVNKSLKTLK